MKKQDDVTTIDVAPGPRERRSLLPLLFLSVCVAILIALGVVIILLVQLLNRNPNTQGSGSASPTQAALNPNSTLVALTAQAVPATGVPPQPPPAPSPSAPILTSSPAPAPCERYQFSDDFQSDLKPEWKRIGGQPVIINGRLGSATDEVTLEIGNKLCNFTVDLSYNGVGCCYLSKRFYLIIGDKLAYDFTNTYQRWQANENNGWLEVAIGNGIDSSGQLRLKVDGTNYIVLLNGKAVMNINYGSTQRGPLQLEIKKGVEVDNFSISSE